MNDWVIVSWEHLAFWKPGGRGYTKNPEMAGRFSEEDARGICKEANFGCHELEPNEVAVYAPLRSDV